MQPTGQDFAETYSQLGDDEIAELYAQRDTLTEPAREALAAEISRRGIDSAKLTGLMKSRRRQEATCDRREEKRRKMVAEFLLPRWRRRFLIAAFALYVLTLIFERLSRHH